MDEKNGFRITNHDRVLRAWENSTELVRDYQSYAREMTDNKKLSELFARYAKDEAEHAAELLEILQKYQKADG